MRHYWWRNTLACLILSLAGVAGGGCSSKDDANIVQDSTVEISPDTSRRGEDKRCTADCSGRECGSDDCDGTCGICPWTEDCSPAGICQPFPCKSSKDCPGKMVCEEDLGRCVECQGDEDCQDGETCGADHGCHALIACGSDLDCKDHDLICDKDEGRCVECLEMDHCDPMEYCFEWFCLPDVCDQGTAHCSEDGVPVTCAADGSALTEEVCPPQAYCDEGTCLALACKPASAWCEGEVLFVCSTDGKAVESTLDCTLNEQHCFGGACTDSVCDPESWFCVNGSTLGECNTTGDDYVSTPCPASESCKEGECLSWQCEPESPMCVGDVTTQCDALGLAPLPGGTDCASQDMSCVAGECVACAPDCLSKECGDNGCGGTCGSCADPETCQEGQCADPLGFVWVPIPAGSFMMGCSYGDMLCEDEELPSHLVQVEGFQILETEVTETQYETVVGEDPSCDFGPGGGPDSPVECVSWLAATSFCESIGGRLCTEAEWEYAARGGTTTKYYCGNDVSCLGDIAWYYDNSDPLKKHDVKGKLPNPYGLYDMLGNVYEWVEDCLHGDFTGAPSVAYPAWLDMDCVGTKKVTRGGGANGSDYNLRVSGRGSQAQTYVTNWNLGFRCCRHLP
jgi:formylglycine-generating enzyme required for sulfatase activity